MISRKKHLIVLSFIALAFGNCHKVIEDKKQSLLINLITDNVWIVTQFSIDGVNKKPDFDTYEFHFYKDETVHAVFIGSPAQPDIVGTWVGSEPDQTITSIFPPSTIYPINKLTGVWGITNTDLSPKLVDAHRFEGAVEYKLRLNAK